MNNERRKRIDEIISSLEDLKSQIEDVLLEEEEYKDNIPENLTSSERYMKAESACDNLDNAAVSLDDITNYLEEAKE